MMAPAPRRRPARRRRRLVDGMPRSARSLRTAEELDDAVLHLVEAVVVGVEHARGRSSGRGGRRCVVPHGSSSTRSSQVRIQPCSGLWPLVRSSRSISFSTALAHLRRQRQVGEPGAVVVDARRRRPRRAPCGWRPAAGAAGTRAAASPCLRSTSLRMRSVDLQLGEVVLGPRQHQLARRSPTSIGLEDGRAGGRRAPRAHDVTASARAPGSLVGAQDLGQAPGAAQARRSPRGRPAARGPAPSTRGDVRPSVSGSTSCHRPLRSPMTSTQSRARCTARRMAACPPLGS